jgi:phosphoenolpyruvate carboxykinase (GTP)
MVNWFRKGAAGNFLWPGYGENMRVLKWMLDRIHDRIPARMTPVGSVPDVTDLDLTGLEISPDDLREALAVKPEEWKIETQSASEFFDKIGSTVPSELRRRLSEMNDSLSDVGSQADATR